MKRFIKESELLFYMVFLYYIILMMYGGTMIMEKVPVQSWMYLIGRLLLVTSIICSFIINSIKINVKFFRNVIIIGLIISIVVLSTGYTVLFDAFLLSVLASNLNLKTIFRYYFIVSSVFLVIVVLASLTGIIQNLVFLLGNIRRQSLGFIYPTDFAAHLFYLWLTYWAFKKIKFNFGHVFIGIALSICVLQTSYAKLDAILFVLSTILFFVIDHITLRTKLQKKTLFFIGICTFPICAFVSLILTSLYGHFHWIEELNQFVTFRISSGKDVMINNGLSLFGKYIRMQGNGWSPKGFDESFGYVFVDNAYIATGLCYGVIFFVIVLISYFYAMYNFYLWGENRLTIIFILVSISNLIDNKYLDPGYSPFFVIFYGYFLFNMGRKLKRYNKKKGNSRPNYCWALKEYKR